MKPICLGMSAYRERDVDAKTSSWCRFKRRKFSKLAGGPRCAGAPRCHLFHIPGLPATDYDIIAIKHVNGAHKTCADFLSRYPTEEYDPPIDELQELPVLHIGLRPVRMEQLDDPKLAVMMEKLERGVDVPNFAMKNGVLHHREFSTNRYALAIPQQWVAKTLLECDDSVSFGCHMGLAKTHWKLRQRYWFPKMRQIAKIYIKSCTPCQARKIPRSKPYGKMQKIRVNTTPFFRVQIDISGPYPVSSNRNVYIISACDYLTKWLETRAIKTADTKAVVKFIMEQIICRHSCPSIIQSDQGSVFTSAIFKELALSLGINHLLSTTYHPQTVGQIERSHQVLHDSIFMYLEDPLRSQKDWDKFLFQITFAINTSVHKVTGFSPFYMLYGREAVYPIEREVINGGEEETIGDYLSRIRTARLIASQRIRKMQNEYARRYDQHRQDHNFEIGDKVLYRKYPQSKGLNPKLFAFFYGRYVTRK
ncbi:Transposon Ty3-I Gag-Pol polyprotein [Folsomia candida]|uniref:RNA-directed DNA polymerase n=1 Tax=Folsomia candida TaxID=158441 RepID=A0A226DWC2_FOLCA|nr:Transposon Ty3-I Gag-Pol polyprotein [Folsomia candida]